MYSLSTLLKKFQNFDINNLGIYKSKLIRIFYPRYDLSPSDIILGTFPKSGTTWLRFIFANIISLVELDGRVVDYKLMNEKLNTAFDPNWKPAIEYNCLPLIRPTHKTYNDRYFGNNKSIYLFRNPKDVQVSFFEYKKSFTRNSFKGDFKDFIRNENFGIRAWCDHINSWLPNATVKVTYESMKKDTFKVIKKILISLDLDNFDDNILKKAIQRSNFKNIKKIEKERGLDARAKNTLNKNFNFARKGKVGEGKVYFDKEDEIYLEKLLFNYNLLDYYKFHF